VLLQKAQCRLPPGAVSPRRITAYCHVIRNIDEARPMDSQYKQPDLHRLHDAARHRARQLRAEAISDFWDSLHAALEAAGDSAGRAARRFAHRLRHHRARQQAMVQKARP
jgi:hypothetical protein